MKRVVAKKKTVSDVQTSRKNDLKYWSRTGDHHDEEHNIPCGQCQWTNHCEVNDQNTSARMAPAKAFD